MATPVTGLSMLQRSAGSECPAHGPWPVQRSLWRSGPIPHRDTHRWDDDTVLGGRSARQRRRRFAERSPGPRKDRLQGPVLGRPGPEEDENTRAHHDLRHEVPSNAERRPMTGEDHIEAPIGEVRARPVTVSRVGTGDPDTFAGTDAADGTMGAPGRDRIVGSDGGDQWNTISSGDGGDEVHRGFRQSRCGARRRCGRLLRHRPARRERARFR